MIISSLIQYGISLDLCWQIIWANFQSSSMEILLKGEFEKMEKYCTNKELNNRLNYCISMEGNGGKVALKIKKLLNEFTNKKTIKDLRDVYNYIKHRGTIHIEGLGNNYDRLPFDINDIDIPKINRKSYSLDELEKLLILYDKDICCFIESLVKELIPEEYNNDHFNLQEMGEFALNIINAK